MVWLAALVTYGEAEQIFMRIAHRDRPSTSIWRQVQAEGERLKQYEEQRQSQTAPERVVLPPPGRDHTQRQGVSMDGGKINIRGEGEGWKEFKVGAVYDVAVEPEWDTDTAEWIDQAHGVNIAYRGVLGSVPDFAPALWSLAVDRCIPQAADLSCTADGAEWIWNVADDLFPNARQIVDWYHATEHVAKAAEALHPKNAAAAQSWQHERRQDLYQGAAKHIAALLEKAGLPEHATYFHTHQRRMQYQEFREEGHPIGSGTVESGIKRFKQRLSGPGMRWLRAAAERMLVLRGAVMSGDFDRLWAAAPLI